MSKIEEMLCRVNLWTLFLKTVNMIFLVHSLKRIEKVGQIVSGLVICLLMQSCEVPLRNVQSEPLEDQSLVQPLEKNRLGGNASLPEISKHSDTALIFQSGFEHKTREILKHTPARVVDLVGQDHTVSAPNHWVKDLEAGGRKFFFNYVDHFNGPNPEMLGAYIGVDPEHENNKVLHTWQKDSEKQGESAFSRVQAELRGGDWKEIYYKVRFRLGGDIALVDSYSKSDVLLSPIEFWIGDKSHRTLNRLILHKWGEKRSFADGKAPLQWRAEIQGGADGHVFESSGVQPLYDQWQTLEFYIKAGDANTGKLWARINESQVIFDLTVATKHPNATSDVTVGSLLKSYGGKLVKEVKRQGGQVEVWYDDVELRNSIPEDLKRENSP